LSVFRNFLRATDTMQSLPVPEFLQPWIGASPQAGAFLYLGLSVVLLSGLLGLYLAVGRGPRRRRAFHRVQLLLRERAWDRALTLVQSLQNQGRLSDAWQTRLRRAEASCHHAAGNALLLEKDYEKGLDHLLQATRLLAEPPTGARAAVVQAMLTEARERFAISPSGDGTATLLTRVLQVQSPCPEAAFWLALCQLREGQTDAATAGLRALTAAEDAAPKRPPDPLLYLGAVLLRQGEAREALRLLTEANRLEGSSPFVVAQLGVAMIGAGGDAGIAVRALQRALGPRGFLQWKKNPQRAWLEGMPESSYVRRLASQYQYVCPLWGADLQPLVRQASAALGEGLYRLGSFKEAGDVFNQLLQDGAPSAAILRGLGLALARQERYDQAFVHLRAANELTPDDGVVAGYLALCAARGKPTRPEDKANNVTWAIWLTGKFDAPGDPEWAGLLSAIFAEARANQIPVAARDQLRLCDTLLAVKATDPATAEAYDALFAADPELVRPEHAWLYARAAQQHGHRGAHALDLFSRVFADESAARTFFTTQGWDLGEAEYAYLERAAEATPGQFPEALGPDYPARGEEMLLQRAARLAKDGQPDAAVAAAEVLRALAPKSTRIHDCLAELHYRRGNPARALELLKEWAALEPANPLPVLRQAVLASQQGNVEHGLEQVRRALTLTQGRQRADVAFLGARLALGQLARRASEGGDQPSLARRANVAALDLLEECLRADPDHLPALWAAAAVRALLGDQAGLAAQAPAMKDRSADVDARFHLFAAACHLAAGDHAAVSAACAQAADDPALAVESAYLLGWSFIHRREPATAAQVLQRVAEVSDRPSTGHARAILGALRFHQGAYDEAVQWWQRMDEGLRKTWGFDQSLAGAAFLAALADLHAGKFASAAGRLREAGKLGLRDRRLGPLLSFALFKAGQQRLYDPAAGPTAERWEEAARFLEQAVQVGYKEPQAPYLLALAYKRQDKPAEARAALRKIAPPDANVLLQLGVLSFGDGQYDQAADEFKRAWEADASLYAAAYNLLLARLAQGDLPACTELLPKLLPLAPTPDDKRFLALLNALLQRSLPALQALPAADPAAPRVNGEVQAAVLAGMGRTQEQRLLQLLTGLGRFDALYPVLRTLAEARPHSPAVQEVHIEAVLVQARRLADRCHWRPAEQLLKPLARFIDEGTGPLPPVGPATQVAFLNLFGACACMNQDFDVAVRQFSAALRIVSDDAWLCQNVALAHELNGRLDEADRYWNSYFDLLDERTPMPPTAQYRDSLAFEGLTRLAETYTRRERWSTALPYVQRAQRLRPNDVDTLERLFHLFQSLRRLDDARRTLRKLRELRPTEPQYELYELDLREVRSLDDIDRMLGDIRRILTQYPNDMRVEERAVAMVGNVLPNIGRMCDQFSDRLARIVEQVRRLPSYQVNWPVVHDEMRKLQREFQKLRKLAQKCLPLVTNEEHRRVVKQLTELIESKIDVCQSLGG
jgi:tetratricopeptide (TPR) repeat protein